MYTCAQCAVIACKTGSDGSLPQNCPMRQEGFFDEQLQRYLQPEIQPFFVASAAVESEGYCKWPRLKETVEFARSMGFTHVGLAFCAALKEEAAVVDQILRKNGFEVDSVICKTGGVDKRRAGIPEEYRLNGPDAFEAMCNPISQAELLNRRGTQLNICLGLCVGHDSLFYRHSKAMVTTLVVKDRVLAHNPVGAIYCRKYFADMLSREG